MTLRDKDPPCGGDRPPEPPSGPAWQIPVIVITDYDQQEGGSQAEGQSTCGQQSPASKDDTEGDDGSGTAAPALGSNGDTAPGLPASLNTVSSLTDYSRNALVKRLDEIEKEIGEYRRAFCVIRDQRRQALTPGYIQLLLERKRLEKTLSETKIREEERHAVSASTNEKPGEPRAQHVDVESTKGCTELEFRFRMLRSRLYLAVSKLTMPEEEEGGRVTATQTCCSPPVGQIPLHQQLFKIHGCRRRLWKYLSDDAYTLTQTASATRTVETAIQRAVEQVVRGHYDRGYREKVAESLLTFIEVVSPLMESKLSGTATCTTEGHMIRSKDGQSEPNCEDTTDWSGKAQRNADVWKTALTQKRLKGRPRRSFGLRSNREGAAGWDTQKRCRPSRARHRNKATNTTPTPRAKGKRRYTTKQTDSDDCRDEEREPARVPREKNKTDQHGEKDETSLEHCSNTNHPCECRKVRIGLTPAALDINENLNTDNPSHFESHDNQNAEPVDRKTCSHGMDMDDDSSHTFWRDLNTSTVTFLSPRPTQSDNRSQEAASSHPSLGDVIRTVFTMPAEDAGETGGEGRGGTCRWTYRRLARVVLMCGEDLDHSTKVSILCMPRTVHPLARPVMYKMLCRRLEGHVMRLEELRQFSREVIEPLQTEAAEGRAGEGTGMRAGWRFLKLLARQRAWLQSEKHVQMTLNLRLHSLQEQACLTPSLVRMREDIEDIVQEHAERGRGTAREAGASPPMSTPSTVVAPAPQPLQDVKELPSQPVSDRSLAPPRPEEPAECTSRQDTVTSVQRLASSPREDQVWDTDRVDRNSPRTDIPDWTAQESSQHAGNEGRRDEGNPSPVHMSPSSEATLVQLIQNYSAHQMKNDTSELARSLGSEEDRDFSQPYAEQPLIQTRQTPSPRTAHTTCGPTEKDGMEEAACDAGEGTPSSSENTDADSKEMWAKLGQVCSAKALDDCLRSAQQVRKSRTIYSLSHAHVHFVSAVLEERRVCVCQKVLVLEVGALFDGQLSEPFWKDITQLLRKSPKGSDSEKNPTSINESTQLDAATTTQPRSDHQQSPKPADSQPSEDKSGKSAFPPPSVVAPDPAETESTEVFRQQKLATVKEVTSSTETTPEKELSRNIASIAISHLQKTTEACRQREASMERAGGDSAGHAHNVEPAASLRRAKAMITTMQHRFLVCAHHLKMEAGCSSDSRTTTGVCPTLGNLCQDPRTVKGDDEKVTARGSQTPEVILEGMGFDGLRIDPVTFFPHACTVTPKVVDVNGNTSSSDGNTYSSEGTMSRDDSDASFNKDSDVSVKDGDVSANKYTASTAPLHAWTPGGSESWKHPEDVWSMGCGKCEPDFHRRIPRSSKYGFTPSDTTCVADAGAVSKARQAGREDKDTVFHGDQRDREDVKGDGGEGEVVEDSGTRSSRLANTGLWDSRALVDSLCKAICVDLMNRPRVFDDICQRLERHLGNLEEFQQFSEELLQAREDSAADCRTPPVKAPCPAHVQFVEAVVSESRLGVRHRMQLMCAGATFGPDLSEPLWNEITRILNEHRMQTPAMDTRSHDSIIRTHSFDPRTLRYQRVVDTCPSLALKPAVIHNPQSSPPELCERSEEGYAHKTTCIHLAHEVMSTAVQHLEAATRKCRRQGTTRMDRSKTRPGTSPFLLDAEHGLLLDRATTMLTALKQELAKIRTDPRIPKPKPAGQESEHRDLNSKRAEVSCGAEEAGTFTRSEIILEGKPGLILKLARERKQKAHNVQPTATRERSSESTKPASELQTLWENFSVGTLHHSPSDSSSSSETRDSSINRSFVFTERYEWMLKGKPGFASSFNMHIDSYRTVQLLEIPVDLKQKMLKILEQCSKRRTNTSGAARCDSSVRFQNVTPPGSWLSLEMPQKMNELIRQVEQRLAAASGTPSTPRSEVPCRLLARGDGDSPHSTQRHQYTAVRGHDTQPAHTHVDSTARHETIIEDIKEEVEDDNPKEQPKDSEKNQGDQEKNQDDPKKCQENPDKDVKELKQNPRDMEDTEIEGLDKGPQEDLNVPDADRETVDLAWSYDGLVVVLLHLRDWLSPGLVLELLVNTVLFRTVRQRNACLAFVTMNLVKYATSLGVFTSTYDSPMAPTAKEQAPGERSAREEKQRRLEALGWQLLTYVQLVQVNSHTGHHGPSTHPSLSHHSGRWTNDPELHTEERTPSPMTDHGNNTDWREQEQGPNQNLEADRTRGSRLSAVDGKFVRKLLLEAVTTCFNPTVDKEVDGEFLEIRADYIEGNLIAVLHMVGHHPSPFTPTAGARGLRGLSVSSAASTVSDSNPFLGSHKPTNTSRPSMEEHVKTEPCAAPGSRSNSSDIEEEGSVSSEQPSWRSLSVTPVEPLQKGGDVSKDPTVAEKRTPAEKAREKTPDGSDHNVNVRPPAEPPAEDKEDVFFTPKKEPHATKEGKTAKEDHRVEHNDQVGNYRAVLASFEGRDEEVLASYDSARKKVKEEYAAPAVLTPEKDPRRKLISPVKGDTDKVGSCLSPDTAENVTSDQGTSSVFRSPVTTDMSIQQSSFVQDAATSETTSSPMSDDEDMTSEEPSLMRSVTSEEYFSAAKEDDDVTSEGSLPQMTGNAPKVQKVAETLLKRPFALIFPELCAMTLTSPTRASLPSPVFRSHLTLILGRFGHLRSSLLLEVVCASVLLAHAEYSENDQTAIRNVLERYCQAASEDDFSKRHTSDEACVRVSSSHEETLPRAQEGARASQEPLSPSQATPPCQETRASAEEAARLADSTAVLGSVQPVCCCALDAEENHVMRHP
ncbi:uncharacterized protein LOC143297503 [Babylonia areolata]|uniref:uncharacterized protein LOC143297503 n=1 Tax=Babylonia areolata TaxID=304850 RepID=UPI003FD5BA2D